MTDSRRSLGAFGEKYAAGYLARAAYAILDTNVRLKGGEIDIVAREGDTLVLVEVRTRRGGRMGTPEESITPRKAQRLAKLAAEYVQSLATPPAGWRIDVVAVQVAPGGRVSRLELLRNAVEESS